MNPPRHAAVVSIDEKSQIQALDRTQPGLPLKRGNAQPSRTITNATARRPCSPRSASRRQVIGRCAPRHRHQESIRFIATVERSVPAGKVIHAILDNYAAHKHPQVLASLPSIRDGRSISRRPPAPGSMPWKASSPSSLARASNGASFDRSMTSKARLPATSPPPIGAPSPSSGPRPQKSSRPSSP